MVSEFVTFHFTDTERAASVFYEQTSDIDYVSHLQVLVLEASQALP